MVAAHAPPLLSRGDSARAAGGELVTTLPPGAGGYHDVVTEELPNQPLADQPEAEPEMDPTRPTEDAEELTEGVEDETFREQTQKPRI
jgi:hypothetical protein